MIGFICAMPLISALFGACGAPPPFATGYVEGEYVLISPLVSAQLMDLPVARGDRVAAGQVVAVMETRDAEIAVAQARGALAQAENQLANLQEGSRPEEIRVLEAALASARAQAAEAEKEVARQESLRSRNVTSQAQLDAARTSVEVARARVDPPPRRTGRPIGPGPVLSARRCGQAAALRSAGRNRARQGRRPAAGELRRLPGRRGHRHLCLGQGGVHAAGHLFAAEPPETGLSDRGAPR